MDITDDDIAKINSEILALRHAATPNYQWNQQIEAEALVIIMKLARIIHSSKSKTYKNSWKKHGWQGSIFPNIARKFDRLEAIFTDAEMFVKFMVKADPNSREEPVVDTMNDSAVYGLLSMTELMLTKPELFDSWLNREVFKR